MVEIAQIEDVAQIVSNAKQEGRKCSLLIGAGCSRSAGIPLAGEFVEEIRKKYGGSYGRAREKTYPHCMAELARGERRDLIGHYVDEARLNGAHLGIAQLISEGFVDRVLTTNFDKLISQACAVTFQFPAVYNFASSQVYQSGGISDAAVIHLHGQRDGFVLLNTPKEVERLSKAMVPVFKDAGENRVWIVVGYSGDNDPVFRRLKELSPFNYRLYWVGYMNESPRPHLEGLLTGDNAAYWVPGFDADSFFVTLCQQLGCFPPLILSNPYEHLKKVLSSFTKLPGAGKPGDAAEFDGVGAVLQRVTRASEEFLGSLGGIQRLRQEELRNAVLRGDVADALRLVDERDWTPTGDDKKLAATAVNGIGLEHWRAAQVSSDEAQLRSAAGYFERAAKLDPQSHVAFNNWGNAIGDLALLVEARDRDALLALSADKYAAAIGIKPDYADALYNWGISLVEQARASTGATAERFLEAAHRKYERSLELNPANHKALRAWGNALREHAKLETGDRSEEFFEKSFQKYREALEAKPDYADALNSWANALIWKAKRAGVAGGATAEAQELLIRAENLSPGSGAYNLACLASAEGDFESAEKFLRRAAAHGGLPRCEVIGSDPDLNPIRGEDWFVTFVREVCP